jgi:hypothetical protein
MSNPTNEMKTNQLPEIPFNYHGENYTLYIINEDGEYYVCKNGEEAITNLPDDADTDKIAEEAMNEFRGQ